MGRERMSAEVKKKRKRVNGLSEKSNKSEKTMGLRSKGGSSRRPVKRAPIPKRRSPPKSVRVPANFIIKKENKYKKKNCKRSTDPEEKVDARVCSCTCIKY